MSENLTALEARLEDLRRVVLTLDEVVDVLAKMVKNQQTQLRLQAQMIESLSQKRRSVGRWN